MDFITSSTEAGVTTITLNRPDKLNAFSGTMREDLLAALQAAAMDIQTRALVITGAGRAFCAGGDVEYMSGLQKARAEDEFVNLLVAGKRIVTALHTMEKPVIASVNGVAAGAGCNLALACDFRIASQNAKFAQSFVKIGIHPDWGGTYFLPRLVGSARAMELMMTGRLVDAQEALAIGLVERVVPADALVEETTKLARALADGPPIALRRIKQALHKSERNDLESQIDLESRHQREAFLSSDAGEGMAAFFEKRAPKFSGE